MDPWDAWRIAFLPIASPSAVGTLFTCAGTAASPSLLCAFSLPLPPAAAVAAAASPSLAALAAAAVVATTASPSLR
eukprot:CAMPEP_0172075954 /NCGR_PEP_ID=MMETSP1043-20130122/16235_1 /TAXON_ID=464988 /ORGANISM="Hemiselmis andersenii, Strain CCMP441" /LENGTH=75 /DNA_ID=CAMNT_0012736745 /DNA_START=29 /DNA_END=253 /DNA_ORIENTATION=+